MPNITGLFRVGRDCELRHTQNGDAVTGLALVFNYGKKADNTSQWIEASLWGKRAEALAPYLLKGQQIYAVIDDPHTEAYQNRDGSESVKLTGRISNIEFAGSAKSKPEPKPTPPPKPAAPATSLADMDSDIPF